MAEQLSHAPAQIDLIEEAFRKNREKQARDKSIEEAETHVPELRRKIEDLLGIPQPPPPRTTEELKEEAERIEQKLKEPALKVRLPDDFFEKFQRKRENEYVATIVNFEVQNGQDITTITLAQGRQSNSRANFKDRSFDITVNDAGYKLKLDERGGAVIESLKRESEPFTMHTPIGVPGRSWPSWSRSMEMEDFRNFDQLLDRLAAPDVVRREVSRPLPLDHPSLK